jgi:hypothetical protein
MKKNAIGFPAEIEGVEILVGYEYEETHVPAEPGFDAHDLLYIDITSVEVVSKGRGIDIYPLLTPKEVKAYREDIYKNHNESVAA